MWRTGSLLRIAYSDVTRTRGTHLDLSDRRHSAECHGDVVRNPSVQRCGVNEVIAYGDDGHALYELRRVLALQVCDCGLITSLFPGSCTLMDSRSYLGLE